MRRKETATGTVAPHPRVLGVLSVGGRGTGVGRNGQRPTGTIRPHGLPRRQPSLRTHSLIETVDGRVSTTPTPAGENFYFCCTSFCRDLMATEGNRLHQSRSKTTKTPLLRARTYPFILRKTRPLTEINPRLHYRTQTGGVGPPSGERSSTGAHRPSTYGRCPFP